MMEVKCEIGEIEQGNPVVLAAAMTTALITTFMMSALNMSIPAMECYFDVNAATISWVVSAYTMTIAAMSLPFGKIADVKGRRSIFLIGIAGFGIMSLINMFAINIIMLIIIRTIQGICAAMIFATSNAILISSYPHSQQGRVLGLSVAATYTGLTIGPVLGGVLQSNFGWKSIFAVSVLTALIAFVVAVKGVPQDVQKCSSSHAFDIRGTILYIAAIILSLYGMTNMTVSQSSLFILGAGIALMIGFFVMESKTADPVIKVSMFSQSRIFTFSNIAALLNYGATFAISYSLSIYFQIVRGYSSDYAGMIMITMPLMQAVFSPLMGSLSDRIRPAYLASLGMGFCAAGLLILACIGKDTSMIMVMGALVIAGLGFAMFSSPNNNAIMNCVEKSDYGVANSIIATMRTYGQSASMAVLNIITGLVLGHQSFQLASVSDMMVLMHVSFSVFVVICIAGLLFSLVGLHK